MALELLAIYLKNDEFLLELYLVFLLLQLCDHLYLTIFFRKKSSDLDCFYPFELLQFHVLRLNRAANSILRYVFLLLNFICILFPYFFIVLYKQSLFELLLRILFQFTFSAYPIGVAVITPSMRLKTGNLWIIIAAVTADKGKAVFPHSVVWFAFTKGLIWVCLDYHLFRHLFINFGAGIQAVPNATELSERTKNRSF